VAKTESPKKEAEVTPDRSDQPEVTFQAWRQESSSTVAVSSAGTGIEMMKVRRCLEVDKSVVMERASRSQSSCSCEDVCGQWKSAPAMREAERRNCCT